MTWDSERSKSGKRPWSWVEIEVDRCSLTYGTAPCTAAVGVTGAHKCFNGWHTCQDPVNYAPAPYFVRFGEPSSEIPRAFAFADAGLPVFLPFLRSVRHAPSLPDPGESMGLRVQLTVEISDAPHHDIGIDKYIAERAYDARAQGLFLRKLKARFPHYIGRRLRWYQGYVTAATALADFQMREYIMERFEGPDAQGRVKIIAKDVLKLLDDDRAQAPVRSLGELEVAFTAAAVINTIDITTADTAEYDLIAGETEDYVRIGDEGFTYTGRTVLDADTVRLTGVTRVWPAPYVTEAADHDIGDAVQRCRLFIGTVPDVVNELMVDYGGLDPAFIPFAEWAAEADTWAPEVISRLITGPEGVQSIVNEIIGQTLTWGFWFDEIEQEIQYRAIRPADVNDAVMAVSDDANLVAGSIRLVDKPDAMRNEVQVLYGQIDPNGSRDTIENYKRGIAVIDADSQSVNETGQRRLKRVFARWWPAASKSAVQQFTERALSARAKNLMEIEFELERKDEDLRIASFADLTTLYLINDLGVPVTTRVQVTRVDAAGERVKFRAREDFFKVGAGGLFVFGRLAPQAMEGDEWTTATQDEKNRYMYLADADEEFSNGDPGKRLA